MQIQRWMTRLALLLPFSLAHVAHGQATFTYDHFGNCRTVQNMPRPAGCTVQATLLLNPGDHFTIVIHRTVADRFNFDIQGFAVAVRPGINPDKSARVQDNKPVAVDSVVLEATHDNRYGGYVLTITPVGDTKDLPVGAATIVLTVPQGKKPYGFSGGISLTGIRNPGYVLRREIDTTFNGTTVTKVDTLNRVRDDTARRDAGTVGFATFATVSIPNVHYSRKHQQHTILLDWLNLAVGIGLETNGETQYYFGGGAEIREGIYLNSGMMLGRVNTLPSGLSIGDATTDANALANLGRRSARSWFVGLSFAFLGGGEGAFGKPFAGSQQ